MICLGERRRSSGGIRKKSVDNPVVNSVLNFSKFMQEKHEFVSFDIGY